MQRKVEGFKLMNTLSTKYITVEINQGEIYWFTEPRQKNHKSLVKFGKSVSLSQKK